MIVTKCDFCGTEAPGSDPDGWIDLLQDFPFLTHGQKEIDASVCSWACAEKYARTHLPTADRDTYLNEAWRLLSVSPSPEHMTPSEHETWNEARRSWVKRVIDAALAPELWPSATRPVTFQVESADDASHSLAGDSGPGEAGHRGLATSDPGDRCPSCGTPGEFMSHGDYGFMPADKSSDARSKRLEIALRDLLYVVRTPVDRTRLQQSYIESVVQAAEEALSHDKASEEQS